MEILEKYLQSVRAYLPREQRDDIIKELSDNILSQMEDKEAKLDRPLTASEQEAIIKQHGAPITVAGRYQLDTRSVAFGRQLIGPVLYPFYIRVLSITVGLSMAIVALTMGLLPATSTLISCSPRPMMSPFAGLLVGESDSVVAVAHHVRQFRRFGAKGDAAEDRHRGENGLEPTPTLEG